MKKGQVVHYQEILENGDINSLHHVKKRNLWDRLNVDERLQLATLFLKAGEEKVDRKEHGEMLCEYCFSAEELSFQNSEVLFHIAALLYRFGITHEEKRYLFLSLGKLIQIEENNPAFFETAFQGFHLWGNLLVALSNHLNDDSFLAKGILKFKNALAVVEKEGSKVTALSEVYWDLAEAYVRLGRKSEEPTDLKIGIEFYKKAAAKGACQFHFWLDFGEAFVFYGLQIGKVEFLRKGLGYFKRVIADADSLQETFSISFARAWFLHAITLKHCVEMTHSYHDFETADKVFQEAILAHPGESAVLWLHWGELFLRYGWYSKDPFLIDKGLEKLSSAKLNELDPNVVTALLAEGLAMLGMCLDDIRLIQEGKKRLLPLLDVIKKKPILNYSAGMIAFAQGVYFADEKYLLQAYKFFEKATQLDSSASTARYMMYEAAWTLSELKKTVPWMRKAMKALERLTELKPDAPLFWSEWGIALLKFHPHDKRDSLSLETAIEKFKIAISKNMIQADIKTLFHYGIALDLLGDKMGDGELLKQSVDLLTLVYEKLGHSLNVRYQLAFAFFHYGELVQDEASFNSAIDLFESVLKYDSEDDASWCGLGLALLSFSEIVMEGEEKLKKQSEEAFMKALKFGSLDANYYLACLFSLQKESDRSLYFLKRAIEIDSTLKIEDLKGEIWLAHVLGLSDCENMLKELNKRK